MTLPLLLRHTRTSSKMSQLELALRLEVSQRHVSFVETGRAAASREMLLAWMEAVDAPASIRNAALTMAGFTTVAAETASAWTAGPDATEPALQRMIQLHNPLPGIVFDPDWRALAVNRSGKWLCSMVMPAYCEVIDNVFEGMDMIHCLSHEDGLLSRARNATQVGAALLLQLQTESWIRPALCPRVERLAESLQRRYGKLPVPSGVLGIAAPSAEMCFDTPHGELNFSTFQSAFGMPHDINSSSLRIELWFPSDDRTRHVMNRGRAVVQSLD
ncbi:helix-turn-helix domain-containing protein [Variovorax paradoxus]|uniref:Helix-turn-helix domain protein n=1 Tax=Variovorax paradoxus (strain EPS) TaxID=595537 RepID=E6V267_VARPE|nr:helix-turn-helix domain-containing protein [Variovorax paradoxus]ADU39146.1 helix-turn-helix domain protein [Variovorax paradoxus EPS]